MKKLMITAAALMVAVAAYGQGSFLFNTHDTAGGNVVTFTLNGQPATGADLFVEVLAGPDAQHLTAVAPALPLNRTGAGAGYTSPFSQVYTTSLTGNAVIGYRAYQGTSYDTAVNKSDVITTTLGPTGPTTTPLSVALAVAPAPPNTVTLGSGSVSIGVPEPATLALGALGLGAMFLIRRRK